MACLAGLDNTQYLQHIKEISKGGGPYFDGREKHHLEACFNFRETLTHLDACHEICHSNTSLNVVSSLPEFKQLEDLNIYNSLDEDLTTFDIQELCPKLTSLDFPSEFDMPDDRVEEELLNLNNSTNSNLQNLEVQFPHLTLSYINYLKDRFPPGSLNKFRIIMNDDMFDWIQEIGPDVALDLAHYLSSFPNDRLAAFPDKEYEKQHVVDEDSKMTRFFR